MTKVSLRLFFVCEPLDNSYSLQYISRAKTALHKIHHLNVLSLIPTPAWPTPLAPKPECC